MPPSGHEEVAKRGNCPTHEQLGGFSAGRLSALEFRAIEDHLTQCSACSTALGSFERQADPVVAALRAPGAPDPFSDEVRQEIVDLVQDIGRKLWAGDAAMPDGLVPPATPQAAGDQPYQRVGQYELIAELGRGGMGVVYQARQPHLDRVVALKIVATDRLAGSKALARFRREMKAVGRLHHPNIVTAFDAGEHDGNCFLVMEYVAGLDVSLIGKQIGQLGISDACEIIRQAAIGLQHAHEAGLVHRDIKPSNLMITTSGQVKLLDLGLALLDDGQDDGEELTATGHTMGTVDYMAPEQVGNSHQVDIRSDIYSLGCTLFRLLCGQAPFSGPKYDVDYKKLAAHVQTPPPSLKQSRADAPPRLAEIIKRLLAKKPADRYTTPAEVADALAPFAVGSNLAALVAQATAAVKEPPSESWQLQTKPHLTSGSVGTVTREPSSPAITHLRTSPRRRWPRVISVAVAVAAAGALLCFGVIVILKNRDAHVIGQLEVPAGGTAIIMKDGKPEASVENGPALAVASSPAAVNSKAGAPAPAVAPFDAKQARAYQDSWAKYLGTTVEQTNSTGMKMVLIPPGEFLMGTTSEQDALAHKLAGDAKLEPKDLFWTRLRAEAPAHRVTLSKPFWLGTTEVTVGQFRQFVEAAKYVTQGEQVGFGNGYLITVDPTVTSEMKKMTWRAPGYVVTDSSPVTQVTWNDAVEFCNWLSAREQLPACYVRDPESDWVARTSTSGYRLPTEAEWEYACRAGTTTQFSFGDDPAMLGTYGWFNKTAKSRAWAVGAKAANPFGLFDMHGNVFERCQDLYADDEYAKSSQIDPTGPASGATRVSRGGNYNMPAVYCRSTYRLSQGPTYRGGNVGFRVVRVAASPAAPVATGSGVDPDRRAAE